MTDSNVPVATGNMVHGTDMALTPPAGLAVNNKEIEQIVTGSTVGEARSSLNCLDKLEGERLDLAKAKAAELFPKMLESTALTNTWGNDVLDEVNDVFKIILHDTRHVEVPELRELMRGLNDGMRSIQHKYDVDDPEVRKKYEQKKGKILGWFRRARSMVQMMLEDVKSMEKQLDEVGGKLGEQEESLMHSVANLDQLYASTQTSIEKLIFVIAVLELIREAGAKAADAVKVGDPSMGNQAEEEKARLADFTDIVDMRINELKNRLFLAWASLSQVRNQKRLDQGLSAKLSMTRTNTIPAMMGVLGQWRLLVQAEDAADLNQLTADNFNTWVQDYYRTSAQTMPKIAEVVGSPTMQAKTVSDMAAAIAQMNEGIIKAMDTNAKQQEEVEAAMQAAIPVISDANQKLSDAVIDRAVKAANKPLEIATSVSA